MLVVGINLAQKPTSVGLGTTVFSMVCIRMVFMPLVGIMTASSMRLLGLFSHEDPLVSVIVMAIACMPTANNINTMCTALATGQNEMATCAFWQMVVFPFGLLIYIPLWIVLS
eukprot:NODE_3485_length_1344_cov_33.809992_g3045_i0.p1 GENE.NODE_3485_length_1344_cov_33.809992_g3045_i0~~NODE_3485_length_1344_cov_33.809992_g3045_i0.p1  ORF type:complete len:113 (+),score=10.48 NODE_3485_length_1344_cov_33.809992_g3045_i0:745-1083(+)